MSPFCNFLSIFPSNVYIEYIAATFTFFAYEGNSYMDIYSETLMPHFHSCIREKFIHALLHQFHILVIDTPNDRTTPTSNATKTGEPTTNYLPKITHMHLWIPWLRKTLSTCCFIICSALFHLSTSSPTTFIHLSSSLHLPQLQLLCLQLTLVPHTPQTRCTSYRWIILCTKPMDGYPESMSNQKEKSCSPWCCSSTRQTPHSVTPAACTWSVSERTCIWGSHQGVLPRPPAAACCGVGSYQLFLHGAARHHPGGGSGPWLPSTEGGALRWGRVMLARVYCPSEASRGALANGAASCAAMSRGMPVASADGGGQQPTADGGCQRQ